MWRSVQMLLPLLATVGLASAAEPKADPAKKDLEKLQGSWVLVYWLYDGEEKPTADRKIVLSFKGSKLTIREDDKVIEEGAVNLDSGKQPKEFEYVVESPFEASYPAIYLVEGDLFIACVGYGMAADIIFIEIGTKLLYAAQVALAAAGPRPRKRRRNAPNKNAKVPNESASNSTVFSRMDT